MVDALIRAGLSQNKALDIIELNPGTYHKRRNRPPRATPIIHQRDRRNPQGLSDTETAVMHRQLRPYFNGGSTIVHCWATAESALTGPGAVASLRTYQRHAARIRLTLRLARTRRLRVAVHTITAATVNHVWAWDITTLPGPLVGTVFYAYTIIDVYSRKIIATDVHDHQRQDHAIDLFTRAINTHGAPTFVHSDNGATMTSHKLQHALHAHNITLTFSRPRTSNDNAITETWFGTYKQHKKTPAHFETLHEARAHITKFAHRYNTSHFHKNLGHHTPDSVYNGTWETIHTRRTRRHARRVEQHPSRFGTRHKQPPKPQPGTVTASRTRPPTHH